MLILAIAGSLVWFLLTGLLWYAKPSDVLWFAGSLLLGVVYFVGFFFYVTRPK
jgi:hypothetical protein